MAKVRATFVEIDQLKKRFQTAGRLPAASSLAADDAVWPRLPLSEHARQCLASTVDHLDLVRLTIEQQRTFPTGLNGVLRGAIVASALSVWLLGPTEATDRRERGLIFSDEWYRRRIQFQKGYLDDLVDEAARQKSEDQIKMLETDREDAAALRTTNSELQATSVIRWAATHVYKEPKFVRAALSEWNRLGGDAHALGWQLMAQETQWTDDGLGGPQAVHVTASLSNLYEPYLCAWGFVTFGLRRFDELGGEPKADV